MKRLLLELRDFSIIVTITYISVAIVGIIIWGFFAVLGYLSSGTFDGLSETAPHAPFLGLAWMLFGISVLVTIINIFMSNIKPVEPEAPTLVQKGLGR